MKTLVIPDGGMPLQGDDFDWFQSGLKAGIEAVGGYFLSPLGHGTLIGCEVQGLDLTEGWVMLAREIYYVPTQVLPSGVSFEDLGIIPDLQFSVDGLEQFADGSSKNTYRRHWAKVVDSRTITGGTPVMQIGSFRPKDWVWAQAALGSQRSTTALLTLQGAWVAWTEPNGNYTPPVAPQARLKPDGSVQLFGQVTGGTDGLICTLPVGYRPISSMLLRAGHYVPGGTVGVIAPLLVQPNGSVTYFSAPSTPFDGALDLSCVRF